MSTPAAAPIASTPMTAAASTSGSSIGRSSRTLESSVNAQIKAHSPTIAAASDAMGPASRPAMTTAATTTPAQIANHVRRLRDSRSGASPSAHPITAIVPSRGTIPSDSQTATSRESRLPLSGATSATTAMIAGNVARDGEDTAEPRSGIAVERQRRYRTQPRPSE